MELLKSKLISQVQEEFSVIFPGLKIAFYQKEHSNKKGSPKKLEYPSLLKLGEVQPHLPEKHISLNPTQTVAHLEAVFENEFGLHAQVFRRSKDLWLQTSATDNWTLDAQNHKGLQSTQQTS